MCASAPSPARACAAEQEAPRMSRSPAPSPLARSLMPGEPSCRAAPAATPWPGRSGTARPEKLARPRLEDAARAGKSTAYKPYRTIILNPSPEQSQCSVFLASQTLAHGLSPLISGHGDLCPSPLLPRAARGAAAQRCTSYCEGFNCSRTAPHRHSVRSRKRSCGVRRSLLGRGRSPCPNNSGRS